MAAQTTPGATAAVAPAKLRIGYHVFLGVAAGFVAIWTFFAWPFAVLTGLVIGKAASDRRLGSRQNATIVQFLAVTGGVLGMLVGGALIGGLISFLVAALASFSERVAENASPVDQTMARVIFCVAVVAAYIGVWVLLAALGFQLTLNFGGQPAT